MFVLLCSFFFLLFFALLSGFPSPLALLLSLSLSLSLCLYSWISFLKEKKKKKRCGRIQIYQQMIHTHSAKDTRTSLHSLHMSFIFFLFYIISFFLLLLLFVLVCVCVWSEVSFFVCLFRFCFSSFFVMLLLLLALFSLEWWKCTHIHTYIYIYIYHLQQQATWPPFCSLVRSLSLVCLFVVCGLFGGTIEKGRDEPS